MVKHGLLFDISCLLMLSVMAQDTESTTRNSVTTSFSSIGASLMSALQSSFGIAMMIAVVGWTVFQLVFYRPSVGSRMRMARVSSLEESKGQQEGQHDRNASNLLAAKKHVSDAKRSLEKCEYYNAANSYKCAAQYYDACGDQKKAKEMNLLAGMQYKVAAAKDGEEGNYREASLGCERAVECYIASYDQDVAKEMNLFAGQYCETAAQQNVAADNIVRAAYHYQAGAKYYKAGENLEKEKEMIILAGYYSVKMAQKSAKEGDHALAAINYQLASENYRVAGDEENEKKNALLREQHLELAQQQPRA